MDLEVIVGFEVVLLMVTEVIVELIAEEASPRNRWHRREGMSLQVVLESKGQSAAMKPC